MHSDRESILPNWAVKDIIGRLRTGTKARDLPSGPIEAIPCSSEIPRELPLDQRPQVYVASRTFVGVEPNCYNLIECI